MGATEGIEYVEDFASRTLKAIDLLLENELETQALVILFSAIDAFAWLCTRKSEVTRNEFKSWCDDYMHSDDVDLRSLDLYAARCSVLHSNTVESSITRTGAARPFYYKRGTLPKQENRRLAADLERSVTVVDIDDLVVVFSAGIRKFMNDLHWDFSLRRRCADRAEFWISFTSS